MQRTSAQICGRDRFGHDRAELNHVATCALLDQVFGVFPQDVLVSERLELSPRSLVEHFSLGLVISVQISSWGDNTRERQFLDQPTEPIDPDVGSRVERI